MPTPQARGRRYKAAACCRFCVSLAAQSAALRPVEGRRRGALCAIPDGSLCYHPSAARVESPQLICYMRMKSLINPPLGLTVTRKERRGSTFRSFSDFQLSLFKALPDAGYLETATDSLTSATLLELLRTLPWTGIIPSCLRWSSANRFQRPGAERRTESQFAAANARHPLEENTPTTLSPLPHL